MVALSRNSFEAGLLKETLNMKLANRKGKDAKVRKKSLRCSNDCESPVHKFIGWTPPKSRVRNHQENYLWQEQQNNGLNISASELWGKMSLLEKSLCHFKPCRKSWDQTVQWCLDVKTKTSKRLHQRVLDLGKTWATHDLHTFLWCWTQLFSQFMNNDNYEYAAKGFKKNP